MAQKPDNIITELTKYFTEHLHLNIQYERTVSDIKQTTYYFSMLDTCRSLNWLRTILTHAAPKPLNINGKIFQVSYTSDTLIIESENEGIKVQLRAPYGKTPAMLYWERKIFENSQNVKIGHAINLLKKHTPASGIALMCGTGEYGYVRIIFDNNKDSHLLIAGDYPATARILIQSFILSIIYQYTPEQCKILLFDNAGTWPNFAHLSQPVITDATDAIIELQKVKMKIAYRLTSQHKHAHLLIILNNYEYFISANKVLFEEIIKYIAINGPAVGIHIVLNTTKVETSVISGVLKAHIVQRIASKVNTNANSKLILGNEAALNIQNTNFILYDHNGYQEVKTPLVTDTDLESAVDYSNKYLTTETSGNKTNKYNKIKQFAVKHRGTRLSQIQLIGMLDYNAAKTVLDKLVTDGILLSQPDDSGKYPLNK